MKGQNVFFVPERTFAWQQKFRPSTKGGFFSESAIRFSDLQISKQNIPKNYPELEI